MKILNYRLLPWKPRSILSFMNFHITYGFQEMRNKIMILGIVQVIIKKQI